jgi:hypothetical protein
MRWLEAARRLDQGVASVDKAIIHAEESRRLNVRALGTKNTVPSVRSGLDALEHSTVALRGLCRAIVDELYARPDIVEPYSAEVRQVFTGLLAGLADAFAAFGRLVREEAGTAADPADGELSAALGKVRDARARLSRLLFADARADRGLWELHGTLLVSIERLLQEIDPAERARQREGRRLEWAARPPAVQAVDRIRVTSRQVASRPIRRHVRRRHGLRHTSR